MQGLQLAAASMALAGLMAGAADAKVILAQPELKKVRSRTWQIQDNLIWRVLAVPRTRTLDHCSHHQSVQSTQCTRNASRLFQIYAMIMTAVMSIPFSPIPICRTGWQ